MLHTRVARRHEYKVTSRLFLVQLANTLCLRHRGVLVIMSPASRARPTPIQLCKWTVHTGHGVFWTNGRCQDRSSGLNRNSSVPLANLFKFGLSLEPDTARSKKKKKKKKKKKRRTKKKKAVNTKELSTVFINRVFAYSVQMAYPALAVTTVHIYDGVRGV